MLAEILSWEILIPIILIVVLFGGTQIPNMARSLGSAKSVFEKGIKEGQADSDRKAAEQAQAATAVPPPLVPT
ncbi:MAG: twin-arginine translocase TatA/TatE family subunit, partial [Acidimicrobiales bacterium]